MPRKKYVYLVTRTDYYSSCECHTDKEIIGIFQYKKDLDKTLKDKRKGEFAILYNEEEIEIKKTELNRLT